MKIYEYKGYNIDKLIRQNDGEVIDCIEGCLLDNILVECKRGLMAIVETYATSNSSKYTVYFSKDRDEIWDVWEGLQEEHSGEGLRWA